MKKRKEQKLETDRRLQTWAIYCIYIYIINLTGQSVSVRTTFSDGRSFQNYSWWWRRDEKHRMREGQGILEGCTTVMERS